MPNIEYPSITDPKLQQKIGKIFDNYKLPRKLPSFNEYCFPKQFTPQKPQMFMSKYLNPKTPYKSVLICYGIGAGKTLTSLLVAEEWKHTRKILIVVPASIVGNFYKELYSIGLGETYITNYERNLLDTDMRNIIIDKANARIHKYYQIMSYHRFVSLIETKSISLDNVLLIMDEIQNVVSEQGSMYKIIHNAIEKAPSNIRLMVMSATPIFNSPVELALTMNLLKLPKQMPTGIDFNLEFIEMKNGKYVVKNIELLKKYLHGYISYYAGAPDFVYPKKIFEIVKCPMTKFQRDCYIAVEESEGKRKSVDILSLPANFMIGTRLISNIAYPNKLINDEGFKSFKGVTLGKDLSKYSIKFAEILKRIEKSPGPVFVYSNFLEYGGIKPFIEVLKYHGYINVLDGTKGGFDDSIGNFNNGSNSVFNDDSTDSFDDESIDSFEDESIDNNPAKVFENESISNGSNSVFNGGSIATFENESISNFNGGFNGKQLKYAVWSGDESPKNREYIRNLYNDKRNANGSIIKIILGSPAIKEGISLFRTRQVHILEPYWNISRLLQIIGRAFRYCSHKDLPEKDRVVNVYMYLATGNAGDDEFVDEYIWNLANAKQKLTEQFEDVIRAVAVDRELFQ